MTWLIITMKIPGARMNNYGNPLLIADLSQRAQEAKTHLSLRMQGLLPKPPAPVNPWRILLGDDPSLQLDTLILYDRLCDEMGQLELGRLLVYEYPWLTNAHVPLLRVWWILSNIRDALAAATPAAWVLDTPQAEIADALSEKLREMR